MPNLRNRATFGRMLSRHLDLSDNEPTSSVCSALNAHSEVVRTSEALCFVLWSLVHANAPLALAHLVMRLFQVPGLCMEQTLEYAEFFAGEAAISKAMQCNNMRVASYDRAYDSTNMDFLSTAGFILALQTVLRLAPGAGHWSAPVCSSFTRINIGTSQRSPTRPLGCTSYRSVQDGNLLVSRLALVLRLLDALGIWWCFEQPAGSLMQYHPRVQALFRDVQVWRVTIDMWSFGGDTMKRLWIYSNRRWIRELRQYKLDRGSERPSKSLVTIRNLHGRKTYTGNKDLRKSQAYTEYFGKAVACLYKAHAGELKHESQGLKTKILQLAASNDLNALMELLGTDIEPTYKGWADAQITQVLDCMAC